MNLVIYEDSGWKRLLPLVYGRAVFQLVCGMQDLLSRVLHTAEHTSSTISLWLRSELAALISKQTGLGTNPSITDETLLLNGRGMWSQLPEVSPGGPSWVGFAEETQRVACIFVSKELTSKFSFETMLDPEKVKAVLNGLPLRDVSDMVKILDWPWEIVHANEGALLEDWKRVSSQVGVHGQIDAGSHILGNDSVHIGEGTHLKPCVVIDAEDGPVWIGDNVKIMPHSYVQGPAYIGGGSLLQPGAVVHEGTTIGPVCKVGGEIEASIVHGYSNKQHDGFLGHSYVGSWVNIAADCINSDLKNTYGTVRMPINGVEVETGEIFVGTVIGDHSKIGINCSIPTGGVIGFCSSVFIPRSPKFVPSFTWIQEENSIERYDAQRGLAVARKVMARRKKKMSETEERIFMGVFEQSARMENHGC